MHQTRNISPNRFAASAAKTLGDFPLLVTGDEAVRILMELPPTQKVWLSLEQVPLPASASPVPAQQQRATTPRQQQQHPLQPHHRLHQLAAAHNNNLHQQEPEPLMADDDQDLSYGAAARGSTTPRVQATANRGAAEPGAISPPRPLVRRALGPREHDKVADLYAPDEEQQNNTQQSQQQAWNASPKASRDARGCFPPLESPRREEQHLEEEEQQQQHQQQRYQEIGTIDRNALSARVVRSPYRGSGRGAGDNYFSTTSTSSTPPPAAAGGSSPGSSVKVFRYDPRSFDQREQQPRPQPQPQREPAVSTGPTVSPPRRRPISPKPASPAGATEPEDVYQQYQQQQQSSHPSGGFLMDRLRATVGSENTVGSRQQQQQYRQQQQQHFDPQQEDEEFLQQQNQQQQQHGLQVPPRTLGGHRGPVHSVDHQPAMPVHLNRSMMLRRDSAIKLQKQQHLQQVRSGSRSAGTSPTRTSSRQFRNVKSTIQRPPAPREVVVPMRPASGGSSVDGGGASEAQPFFLSTAQHFPTISPSRDRGGHNSFYTQYNSAGSPVREDRRGRKGVAWVVN